MRDISKFLADGVRRGGSESHHFGQLWQEKGKKRRVVAQMSHHGQRRLAENTKYREERPIRLSTQHYHLMVEKLGESHVGSR
jgi:hypothetical protein